MKIAVVGVEYVELSIAMFWRIAQGIIMVGKSGENKQLYLADLEWVCLEWFVGKENKSQDNACIRDDLP